MPFPYFIDWTSSIILDSKVSHSLVWVGVISFKTIVFLYILEDIEGNSKIFKLDKSGNLYKMNSYKYRQLSHKEVIKKRPT